ncbi:MAG: secondary thiamine-phosphate synthase enzyme [Candidatus Firestonebacteria bacterium RIFOXYC2_FULL_39_67]|nr:MAG: secondary thiamine-phosphate synthase enzyme [Candidatus Firestonebacteria bacterium RIFOXYD2_FULL_39_29]OGF56975.1 MAG: secondary thiamine-phosphate synthase enzyme [Candidatus Firestonebacteria bacterium RIFOXYC2_FULL_39_67]
MQVCTEKLKFKTTGNLDVKDITNLIDRAVQDCAMNTGTVTIFVPGATGALTTIEYEPGLVTDLKEFMEKIIPENDKYKHNVTHSDKNGHSHIRATLLGPSLVVPYTDKKLLLGIFQHIIFLDFDNRPRDREVILQIMGK